MSGAVVRERAAAVRAAFDALAACDLELLTRTELLAVGDELQTLACQLPTLDQRVLARLQAEATPKELGAKSWKDVLATRWRISSGEAHRRLTEAGLLAPRRGLTGEPMAPVLAATAAAQGFGLITAEHVEVIRTSMRKLPGFVDTATQDQFEVDLVRIAAGHGPKELKEAAELTLFLLDQDGAAPDDDERARRRGFTRGKQRHDGMIPISGDLTPEAWAVLEVLLVKFAAPGMCNPADPEPCTSGTPTQAQIDADDRTLAQRQHDALVAIGRMALMSGELGQLNGLPVSVIIRTTLQDLESRAGIGVTGGGTKIPIRDVVRMGAHANHYLAVFDRATGSALDLFRARRTASPTQRIMLIARDGGCTKPCCTVGAYGTQVHHAATDWSKGGYTNVDDMGLACGPDNRLVDDLGWTTSINTDGDVEWTPPPELDTGQSRVNTYHRPERLLRPPDPLEPERGHYIAAQPPPGDGGCTDPESTLPPRNGDPDEPGGPAPPTEQAA